MGILYYTDNTSLWSSNLSISPTDTFEQESTIGEIISVYENCFSDSLNMRERNKFIFLFINRNIKRLEIIKAFINDDAFSDLHPSIIKSFLVATQSLNGIEEERAYADNLLSQKLV